MKKLLGVKALAFAATPRRSFLHLSYYRIMGGNKYGNNGATDGADEYRSRADDDLERRLKEFYAELYSVAQQEQSDKTDGTNPAA